MKKNNILFVILCTALLGSCEKGTNPNGEPVKGVSIVPKGIVTRASLPSQAAAMGNEISSRFFILGEGDGAFRVLEKVYQVDGPDTRGAEATSDNVADLFGEMTVAAYNGSSIVEGIKTFSLEGNRYAGTYNEDPWNNGTLTLNFFMLLGDSGASDLAYNGTHFSFSYTTPGTASSQPDLLFSSRSLDLDTYRGERSSHDGASATFHHALTGVKFNLDNETATTKITSITLHGLSGTATCSYPVGGGAPSWSNPGGATADFSETANPTGEIFWLIPQTVTNALTMDIEYTVNGISKSQSGLEFGNHVGPVSWGAGEIREYTLAIGKDLPYDVVIVMDNSLNLDYETGFTRTDEGAYWVDINSENQRNQQYFLFKGEFRPITAHGNPGNNGNPKYIDFIFDNEQYYLQRDGWAKTTAYQENKVVNLVFNNVILHQTRSTSLFGEIKSIASDIIDDTESNNPNNRVALVTFSESGALVSGFTDNYSDLRSSLSGLGTSNLTFADWSAGLSAIPSTNRSSHLVVVFIAGSTPTSITSDMDTKQHGTDDNAVGTIPSGAQGYSVWVNGTPSEAVLRYLNEIGTYSTVKPSIFE